MSFEWQSYLRSPVTSLLLTLNLLLHSAFIWGRFAVFRVGDQLSPGAKLVQATAPLCILFDAILILRRSGSHSALDPLAVAVSAISGILFAWAVRTTGLRRLATIFSDNLPAELIVSGPFRFVRNPFYLAYVLAYFQALVASRSWWAACPLVVMGSLYFRAAILEEKRFLGSRLALQYRRYTATTGRFLPLLVAGAGSRRAPTELENHERAR
jgi:protein-S-isoprenylcysteine O-methyltransferase Ste14